MRITDIECIMLRLPEVQPIADGTQDTLIVQIHTDEGLVGIGEAHTSPWIVKAIIEAPTSHYMVRGLKELLVGEDPRLIRPLWDKMYRFTSVIGRRGVVIHAISAIDIALWDLLGKITGEPICTLLGGAYRTRLEPYASILALDSAAASVRRAEQLVSEGFRAVKIGWSGLGQDVEADVNTVREIRAAVGNDVAIMVDIGEPMRHEDARALANRLHELRVAFLEEPLAPDDIDGYAALVSSTDLPIAAGEKETTRFAFRELVDRRALDIIQPDIARAGGFTECLRIADHALSRGVRVIPHCWSTDILVAASCHFAAALANRPYLEFALVDNAIRNDLILEPIVPIGGHVEVPEGPGLGIELDHDVIDQLQYVP